MNSATKTRIIKKMKDDQGVPGKRRVLLHNQGEDALARQRLTRGEEGQLANGKILGEKDGGKL